MTEDIQKHSVHTLVFRSLKRTHDMFLSDYNQLLEMDDKSLSIRRAIKTKDEYGPVMNLPSNELFKPANKVAGAIEAGTQSRMLAIEDQPRTSAKEQASIEVIEEESEEQMGAYEPEVPEYEDPQSRSLLPTYQSSVAETAKSSAASKALVLSTNDQTKSIAQKKNLLAMPKPQWHAPWKLYRVISGHLGWVRCVDVEPGNEWFATGSTDRLIKIWDLATGTLKLSLTGHISAVRGVAVSPRHPFLFSCGEDKQVKCWDLEYNKVIRHYHGHLSACHAISIHPSLDVLVTAGRDSVARLWDMRTKAQIHCLEGHTDTVATVKCQEMDPQIITGSHDSTIRCWDIIAGKTMCTLTNHKKSVRSIVMHPKWNSMASASPDNIKEWKLPKAEFVQNLSGHNAIVNALACNSDNVLVSAADNGSMYFWDWLTGYNFQRAQTVAQSGSIDSEMGIFALAFDQSGSRLISCEADKTIKIYKEDEEATEETHPINWKPDILKRKRF